ncbi:MAG: hypothetical protein LIO91_02875 [Bacteroidales bacterium]|nr:hypothetical protein [Bacteroidales bacterium]
MRRPKPTDIKYRIEVARDMGLRDDADPLWDGILGPKYRDRFFPNDHATGDFREQVRRDKEHLRAIRDFALIHEDYYPPWRYQLQL